MCVPSGCSVSDSGSGFVDTCRGDTICDCGSGVRLCTDTGACVSAYMRRYTIQIIRVRLPAMAPGGGDWDGFGAGEADPYVVLTVDAIVVGMTRTGSNVLDHIRAHLSEGARA